MGLCARAFSSSSRLGDDSDVFTGISPKLLQFYSLISAFSPPNYAGKLSEISFLSVWKKTCGALVRTRSWIIHQVSEPPGPASSIRWTESTLHHPTLALVHKTPPARCRPSWLIPPWYRGHYTVYSQGPNLSVVLPPSKWTNFLQKYQGRDWKNNNSLKRLWQSLDHLCV